MTRKLFDFRCSNDHTTEHLTLDDQREIVCPVCGEKAMRIISKTSFVLEGVSGDFPTAHQKWAETHEKAAKTNNP